MYMGHTTMYIGHTTMYMKWLCRWHVDEIYDVVDSHHNIHSLPIYLNTNPVSLWARLAWRTTIPRWTLNRKHTIVIIFSLRFYLEYTLFRTGQDRWEGGQVGFLRKLMEVLFGSSWLVNNPDDLQSEEKLFIFMFKHWNRREKQTAQSTCPDSPVIHLIRPFREIRDYLSRPASVERKQKLGTPLPYILLHERLPHRKKNFLVENTSTKNLPNVRGTDWFLPTCVPSQDAIIQWKHYCVGCKTPRHK